jgi:hypothetical protein
MDNTFHFINQIVNIDNRLDLDNINKINKYIGEIVSNSENLITDNFDEQKFKPVDKVSFSHRDSDTYSILNSNNNFFGFRRLYNIFGDDDNIEYINNDIDRKGKIFENDIEDAKIREMFESIYTNFIESNTEEFRQRSKKPIDEIYNFDAINSEKSFDDFYKLDFESSENKRILEKIINKNLKKLYKCSDSIAYRIYMDTITKDEIYTARGWYIKDELLRHNMEQHNLLGTCIFCKDNFTFEEISYFKTIPHQKCKINNIQTNNLFCVCSKCYISKEKMYIMNAPNSINEIKVILYSKYGNMYELNHKHLYEKTYTQNKIKLKEIKKKHDTLVNKLNYYRHMNRNLEAEVEFEKKKHDILKNLVDKNKELISNYFYFVHSVEHNNLSNIKTIRNNIEEIINSKIKPNIDRIECKICMDNEVSLMMPCGHNICKDCYKKLKPSTIIDDAFSCPHCRTLITDDSVKPFFIS